MLLNSLLFLLVFIGLAYFWLRYRASQLSGEDLSVYDAAPPPFATAQPSEGLDRLNNLIREMFVAPAQSATSATGWEEKRKRFDAMGLARKFGDIEFRPDVISINGQDISGGWTLAPGYDSTRRLLYMHGGAFTVGSDISHRPLTVQLARRTGLAVFAPNYRLMPENTRQDGINDGKAAYNWICETGPDGPAPATKLALAGDSAGGNLVLMLANWARKHTKKQPDAVIAFSPTTDATLSSPSMRTNLATDHMLRPLLKPLVKMPRLFRLPAMQHHYGMSPADPVQSPVFDDLEDLPPTLVQASKDEMLYDDAVRYTGKARSAGSPVNLQSWDGGLPHVWQIFDDYIPEAHDALDKVEEFLAKYV